MIKWIFAFAYCSVIVFCELYNPSYHGPVYSMSCPDICYMWEYDSKEQTLKKVSCNGFIDLKRWGGTRFQMQEIGMRGCYK